MRPIYREKKKKEKKTAAPQRRAPAPAKERAPARLERTAIPQRRDGAGRSEEPVRTQRMSMPREKSGAGRSEGPVRTQRTSVPREKSGAGRSEGPARTKRTPRRGKRTMLHAARLAKRICRAIILAIYRLGLLILTGWDLLWERALQPALRFAVRKGRRLLRRGLVLLHRGYRHLRGRQIVRAAREPKKKYPAKVTLLAVLSGMKREEITLPLTEEEKGTILRGSYHRVARVGAPLLCAGLILTVVLIAKDYMLGVRVSIDGEEVGVLASREDFDTVLQSVETYITETTGAPYEITVQPTFQNSMIRRDETRTTKGITDLLYSKASDVVGESYGLYVDGELVAVNPNGEGIEETLAQYLVTHSSGTGRNEFVQKVEVREGLMPKQYEASLLEISEYISAVTPMERVYTAESGDTAQAIADGFGMTVTEFEALNAETLKDGLSEGETVRVTLRSQPLQVKTVETITYEEEIPFERVETETEALYKGQSKVEVAGVAGAYSVTAEVTFVDGVEVGRQEVARTVAREPVAEQVLVGVKAMPEKAPTGTMRRPVGGTITANYGRYSSGKPHTGVDFANPTGTLVVAADGGTVVTAGWSGSYGWCVVIDHGNGLRTRYAHNSALLVKVGQKVAKGEAISRVGSTGNSTGPHLHFEVIKNGAFQNPWNYIS